MHLFVSITQLQVEENLELYKKKYDIVIVQDETLQVVNALVKSILKKT